MEQRAYMVVKPEGSRVEKNAQNYEYETLGFVRVLVGVSRARTIKKVKHDYRKKDGL
jgi:hypothetical protein